MKDGNVNRGSTHGSDDVLHVSPCFFFTSLHFSFLQGCFIKKKKKEVTLLLCINLKTFWWVASLQLFSSSWRGVEPGFQP